MRLPTADGGATTDSVGLFKCDSKVLATWLADGLGLQPTEVGNSFRAVLEWLSISPNSDRFLVVPLGAWAALLTNGPTGTDVGVLPSYAARELGCPALRAVAAGPPYPATILELFEPGGKPPLLLRRSVVAAKDGEAWVFEAAGSPMIFEETDAYSRRRKADRFTPDMLYDYLDALGVPAATGHTWERAIALTSA